jgi:vitamin B12 transporter
LHRFPFNRRQTLQCGLTPYCTLRVAALALGLLPAAALAQTELPPLTVQGATLEAPPKGKAKSAGVPAAKKAKADAKEAVAKETDATEGEAEGVPAASVGNSVTVITRKDLERLQVRQVADALRSLPGVAVGRTGAYGNFTQVRIRGAEGNHTLVLIDGVEANNTTDGELDFSNLSADDIERIEVIRGPMSALYGSSAVGGVINIVTRRGQGPLTLTLKTEAGSLGTGDVAARLAAGSQWAHFALNMHWRSTDGFNISPFGNEADGMLLRSFNLRGGVKLIEGLTLDLTLRHVDKKADRDGFGDPSPAAVGTPATAMDAPSFLNDQQLLAGLRLKWDTFDNKLTHQLHVTYNSTTISDQDLPAPPLLPFFFSNVGERTTYGYLGTYRFDTPGLGGAKHAVSGLIEKETEVFIPKGDLGDNKARERDRLAFAGEWRTAFADQLFLTAGVRHDDNSVFDDFTTWRLAAAWAIKSLGLRPHASVGTAVKFPAMFEQFGQFPGFFVANPDLKPEQSLGWDAGVEFSLGKPTTLDVTYFHADLTDKIAASGLAFPAPSLINLPGVSTRDGLELTLRTRLSPSLLATFAYTYLLAEDSTGLAEIRRPRHAGRADLAYLFAGGLGTAHLGVAYNGSMTDSVLINGPFGFPEPAGRLILDDYWLVNAAVSYKLQPGVELFGRVENLLDQRYQEGFGFEAAPITAFAGVKLTFGGPDGIGGSGAK